MMQKREKLYYAVKLSMKRSEHGILVYAIQQLHFFLQNVNHLKG